AGAEMLIVVNDADGEFSEWSGPEDYESDAPIPVASVSGVEGAALLARLSGKTLTIEAKGVRDSKVVYDIARYSDGSIPSDLAFRPKKLARIDTRYYGEPETVGEFRWDFAPGVQHGSGYAMRTARGIEREEWVNTDEISWYQDAT